MKKAFIKCSILSKPSQNLSDYIIWEVYWHQAMLNFQASTLIMDPSLPRLVTMMWKACDLRTGGRTYFGQNDLWRIEGYTAYGFKDDKFKYGISGKWLLDKKNRLIVSAGNRRDVEQIGANLTSSSDVLGRSLASSSVIGTSTNDKLTNVNLTTVAIELEPIRNVNFRLSGTYRTLESASSTFSLDYYTDDTQTTTESTIQQYENALSISYYPTRKMTGFGVERRTANDDFASLFAIVTRGDKSIFGSDFDYTKVQASYVQPWALGGLGRLTYHF